MYIGTVAFTVTGDRLMLAQMELRREGEGGEVWVDVYIYIALVCHMLSLNGCKNRSSH